MEERADELGLSLSLSSSLAPRTDHHVAMLLRSPGKCKLLLAMLYYAPAMLYLQQMKQCVRFASCYKRVVIVTRCVYMLLWIREKIPRDATAPREAERGVSQGGPSWRRQR
jgi:hypothetical protein